MSGSSPGLDLNANTEQGSTLQEPFTCSQSCRRAGVELATSFSDPASHAAYKWDYWPHDDVRAECRFVGLTNLGATCYLASTIQQLYMIPEARQAVFTAKVRPARPLPGPGQAASLPTASVLQYAEDIKHKTTLLELQKMFTYLMVSF